MEFGLGPCLQTEVELLAMLDDFLHHRTDLVHLDRIDDEVLGIVTIFLGSLSKAGGSLLDAVVDDVGETHQHRSRHIAQGEVVHHLLQIHFHTILPWCHSHISLIIDTEIVHTPTIDAVQLVGVFNAPFSHIKPMI